MANPARQFICPIIVRAGGTTMMVAPGIAASVAARFATTPGGKPSGRLGRLHPAAAARFAQRPPAGPNPVRNVFGSN